VVPREFHYFGWGESNVSIGRQVGKQKEREIRARKISKL
jgi:hypothetical protein